jgi:uroporphyrinogen decarboxylase
MNSRERVLAALHHREPDAVPVDLSGHRSSGISAIAYARLRKYLGLPEKPIRVYDPVQQLSVVDEDVLDLFNIDTIEIGRAFAQEDRYWADWVLPDGTPCQMPVWAKPVRDGDRWILRGANGRVIAQMPDGALYFEQTYYPFCEGEPDHSKIEEAYGESMWTAVASPPGPITSGPEGDRILREGARQLRASTDRAIIGLFGGNLLEGGQFLYRNDNFFLLLAGEPDRAHDLLDNLVGYYMPRLESFLRAVGPYIDIILFGDDLGMQTGPQVSPKMYREMFKPRHAAMWRRAKELADVKVMLHCCGGVRELLPDLIDAGLDAINPVQISCRGMEAAGLKRDFGDRMVFWGGGCDTQVVLSQGSTTDVRNHVLSQLRTFAPGGGFVFQQVHNILSNVPPENIVAMYAAVKEFNTRG